MAKIALDAGHGLYTPGKRCLKKLDKRETREWIINDRVTDALELYLKLAGHSVLRVDDWDDGHTDVTLNDRVRKANNWKADAYISVHHNAGINGGSGGGTVVYVSKGCQAKSIKLQEAVYKRVIVRGKLKGNRYDGTLSANFYVIRKTKMPAILIECGFMDSAVDIKHILDTDWSEQVGLGIAEGVCEVFGGSIPDQKPSKPSPKPDKPVGKSFLVRVKTDLNIRKGPGAEFKKEGCIKDKGTYTIVQTAKSKDGGTWGKLKSGAGWINIGSKYVKRL